MWNPFKKYFSPTPSQPSTTVADMRELSLAGSRYVASKMPEVEYQPDTLLSRKGLEIIDKMRTDDQVKSSLVMKKQARLSLGWHVEPVNDTPQEVEIAEFLNYCLSCLPGSFEKKIEEILTALDYGFSVTEKVYGVEEYGRWSGKVIFKDWKTRKPHHIHFVMDSYGNLDANGIEQFNKRLPTDKFIVYSYGKEFDNWYGTSDLRAAYRSWWSKDIVIKFWNIYLERFGQPPIMGKTKDILSPEQRTMVAEVLESIQHKSEIVVPPWLEIALLESMKGTASYENAINIHNMMIARSVLVPDLVGQTGNAGQGSFALGQKHFDVFVWVLNKIGKDLEETVLMDQVVKDIITKNFGRREAYPRIVFESVDGDNLEAKAKLVQMGIDAGFVDPTENWVRPFVGLPKLEKGRKLPPRPQQPPPPSQPKPKMQKFAKEKFRAKTLPEQKVQFKRIDSELTTASRQVLREAATVIQKQVEGLVAYIKEEDIVGKKDTAAVEKLEVKGTGNLKKIFLDALLSQYKTGQKDVKGELVEVGVKFAVEPDLRVLTPTEAVEYLSSTAFTWAGSTSSTVLSTVKLELLNGIKNGRSTEDVIFAIQQDLEPFLGTDVIDEAALTTQRLENMIRTKFTEAYNEGRKAIIQDPDVADDVPVMMYSSILDDRTTDTCRALDGLRFYTNNPVWKKFTPPNHYSCRSIVVPVTRFELEEGFEEDEVPNVEPAKGFFYSEEQARDERGRFGPGGSGGSAQLEKADAAWEDYSIGSTIKQISEGNTPKVGDTDIGGNEITQEDISKFQVYEKELQSAAESSISKHSVLYRGEIYTSKDEVASKYRVGSTYTTKGLTATTNNKELGMKYTDPQFIGALLEDETYPVILRISSGNGIRGYDRKSDFPETILPKGTSYRVSRTSEESVGGRTITIVDLYQSKTRR